MNKVPHSHYIFFNLLLLVVEVVLVEDAVFVVLLNTQ